MPRFLDAAIRALGRPLRVLDPIVPCDAIIVLGTPLTTSGSLSDVGDERVRAGVFLWQRGVAPVLCFAGGDRLARPSAAREADVMAARARQLGVAPAAIRVERESRTTRENAEHSRTLLGDAMRRVCLVSQPFHGRRARRHFRAAGFEVGVFFAPDSIELSQPRRALPWLVREYAAWLVLLARRG